MDVNIKGFAQVVGLSDERLRYYKRILAFFSKFATFHFETYTSIQDITNPQSNVIYLIGPKGDLDDKYEEYIYDDTKQDPWIKIGDTAIDLSQYVTVDKLIEELSKYTNTEDLNELLAEKQNTEPGKGLSTNDFTNALKNKLDSIQPEAEKNVNADWNSESGDSQILNKPSLLGYPDSAIWDEENKNIVFKHQGTILPQMTISGANFIKDGMVDNVKIENGNLIIIFNTESGKQPITIPISEIFDADNYYTKTQTDDKFVQKVTGKQLSTEDFTTGEKNKLSGIENNAQVNILDGVKVNDVEQTISEKKVNISVPTALSQLSDDDSHRVVTDTEKTAWNNKYTKPSGGIPISDLAEGVIPDVSQFITRTVQDLLYYYTKNETYNKEEVNNLIAAIHQFRYEIYATIADITSPEINVLYLVGPTGQGSDKYEEYVYANNVLTKIGDTTIDLSDYVKKVNDAVNGHLAALNSEGRLIDSGLSIENAKGLKVLSYGNSTWADFTEANDRNAIVYCKASSNSDPSVGSQNRFAFMAYVGNNNVEFQYYRSVKNHSADSQGDEVYVYILKNDSTWSVEVRKTYTKIVAGNNIVSVYSNGVLTLSVDLSGKQDKINDLDNIRAGAAAGATAYQKPSTGIPSSDIANGVIPDVSQFITKTVNNLTNYYLKSETYTRQEVENLIAAISQFHYEIYVTLPVTGENNVLYLIGPIGSGNDKYEEYVYANNTWTKIGDTSIDLSNYVTTEELNTALNNFIEGQGIKHIISITKEEYEALVNKDDETIYIVNKTPISFGGLQISSGPLYYDGNKYAIHEHWNNDSYMSAYGTNAGSTYFSFINLGKLFEKEDFSSSDGDIDNLLNPLNNWRLPTKDEWQNIIINNKRIGSTVNGTSGCRYSLIQLKNVTHARNNKPKGLLIFPDKAIITGRALNGFNTIYEITNNVTNNELEVYINQGCAFIPCSGYNNGSWNSGGSEGKYQSSSENAQYYTYLFYFNGVQISVSGSYGKSDYHSVRLVKPIETSYKLYKGNNLLIPEPPAPITPEYMTEITWSELKILRDNSQLIPGMQYRITDYITTTVQTNTQSAGHQFDIIVIADTVNKLNENARACLHEGDIYFANSKLEAWELKYRLDNDAFKYAWANSTNGKGVIYYMKDEWNNECPYDFKNIQFKRYKVTATSKSNLSDLVGTYIATGTSMSNFTVDENQSVWRYTFNTNSLVDGSIASDSSLKGFTNSIYDNVILDYVNDVKLNLNGIVFNGQYCYGNSFGTNCYHNTFGDNCNKNQFGNYCYNNQFASYFRYNTFGNYYRDNTFGNNFQYNTFGNSCEGNTFGNNFQYNTFGNNCCDNTFGNNFQYNTFGNSFSNNTFGNGCGVNIFGNDIHNNTFGNNCNRNQFGNSCGDNTFGNNFQYNTFGNNCGGNTFGNECYYNTFGNECKYIRVLKDYVYYIIVENGNKYIDITSTQTTSSSNKLMNFTIFQGVNNTTTYKTISHNTLNNAFKTTYQSANSQTINV